MAVFSHGNRIIAYHSQFAPFQHDLLLLQSSRFNLDFWNPVLEDLKEDQRSSGRIVTCDWHSKDLSLAELVEDLNNLLQTMGLHTLHVVACDDAVKVVNELERKYPGSVTKTLLYPQSLPKMDDLARTVREFSAV
jgi:hypothetical protein